METLIRNAENKDVPAILNIVNEAIQHTTAIYDYQQKSLTEQESWFQQKQAAGMPVIVAEYQSEVVGFGTYGIFRPKDAYQYSAEHSIYVSAEMRGKGIGKKLLQEIIQMARKQGYHTLIAGIDAHNRGSIAFHQTFGFVEVGRFKEVGYKFDRWLDLIFLQLLL